MLAEPGDYEAGTSEEPQGAAGQQHPPQQGPASATADLCS